MLTVHKIYPVGFASNTYLLTVDQKSAVAIDPSQDRVITEAKKLGLKIEAVLLTHGHFDHFGGCNALFQSGVPIYCRQQEEPVIFGDASLCRAHHSPMPEFKVEKTLFGGQKITLCGMEIAVISTPGHTVGGTTYLVEDHLFTGDTLFRGCIGRTDLPTGDQETLINSVKKLYALSGDYQVHPGHEDDTTLDFERKYNMCVRG